MKKIRHSLSNMSLLQQMCIIIATFALFIAIFFVVYLRGNINDFVDTQCMTLIERSQETIVDYYKNNDGHSELTYDADVMHFVFVKGKMKTYFGSAIYSESFLADLTTYINNFNEEWLEANGQFGVQEYYYRIITLDKNTKFISLLNVSYGQNIESQLLSRIANNSFLVISLLFLFLIIWVSSIIAPLQQIKAYIDKVRKGDENAKLSLERNDEIGELSQALVEMRNEIAMQEQTKEEMIHNISHDLKTPIAVIKTYAESIKDGIYPYGTLDKSIDVIVENADRLEKKVYSLLFLNRLDYVMEQEKDTDKTTNMNKLLESVILSLKLIRQEVIIDKFEEPDVYFKGDEESWFVVISNLLDNALRYAKTKIVLDLQPYSVTVYNDGPQVAEEKMKKLFKPFEKGDKGKFGLGLSICYKVCATYGYKIEVENMPEGVIFIISAKEIPDEKTPKHNWFVKEKKKETKTVNTKE